MITIYGRTNSSNVQLVMWAIHELGVPHERLDYGHGHASAQSDAFRKMNPMGLVPVLEENGVTIFESAAILRYLGARHGDETFWPTDPLQRAVLDQWAEWGKNTFAPAVLKIFVHEVRTLPEDRDPAVFDAACRAVTGLATMFDSRLEGRDFIGGDALTFADIACGHILHRYFTLDWKRPDLSNLAAYYERLQSRTAYRDHAMVSYDSLRGTYLMER